MSAMLFALIFPRAERASTFDISAARNVWLQSALRSFAIVCDYMETSLYAIVCDPRASAIVCDHMETSLKPGFHMSGKSETVGDFTVSRPSQILQIYRIFARGLSQTFPIVNLAGLGKRPKNRNLNTNVTASQ